MYRAENEAERITKGISNRAYDLRISGDFNGAEEIIKEGLEKYPKSTELHTAMGFFLKAKSLDDDALDYFEKAYDLNRASKYTANNYGRQLAKCGYYKNAEEILIANLDINTEDSRDFVALGIVYLQLKKYEMGITCLVHAANMPGASMETIEKCRSASQQHKANYSEECWQELLNRNRELRPQKDISAQGYLKEARSLVKEGKTRNAVKVLTSALKIFQDDPYLMNLMGNTLRRHIEGANPDEIMKNLKGAHIALPNNIHFAIDYASCLGRQGDPDEAEKVLLGYYDPAASLNVTQRVLLELGNFYKRQHRLGLSAGCFEGLLLLDVNDRIANIETTDFYTDHGFEFDGTLWKAFLDYRKNYLPSVPTENIHSSVPQPLEPQ